MTPEHWARVASTFEDALTLDPSERSGWLARRCADEPAVLLEVSAMLAVHADDAELSIEKRLLASPRDGTDEPRIPAGAMLGAYRIEAIIGTGGMGEVYRAQRVDEYRQTVAIKVLRSGVGGAMLARRFERERQILARLEHPNIVPLLDGGRTADGWPYLVMRHVEGEPITTWCESRGVPLEAKLRLFCRVAHAVQFAHGRLIVHRDLKPSNILVDAAGEPQLLDFGIAKVLDESEEANAEQTRTIVRVMTPEHAAPEQLRGEPVTTATDVYALGILLYLLLTGQRPGNHRGSSAPLSDEVQPPSAIAGADEKRVRGDLDRIVLMALRAQPERRYASAGQLAEDVERFMAGLPVRAQRDTLAYRAKRFVARNRAGVAIAAALALLLVGFSASTTVQSRRTERERDRAEAERATAEAVVALLSDLFRQGNPGVDPGGDTMRVAALLDEGERRVDALSAQPTVQAKMWHVLGSMRAARGELERAISLLRRSYDAQRALPDADPAEAATTYYELARATHRFNGAAAALPLLDSAVTQLAEATGDASPDVADALVGLAYATEQPSRRAALVDSAASLVEKIPNLAPMPRAANLNGQGSIAYEQRRYVEAAALFERSLRLLDAVVPRDHPNRLTVSGNLASAFMQAGEWARAEPIQRENLEIRRQARAPDSAAIAYAIGGLAVTLAYSGRLEEAEAALRESIGIQQRVVAADNPAVDATLRNLALLVGRRGRHAEALTLYDSAIARATRREGRMSQAAGLLIGESARVLVHLARLDEAAAVADEGRRIVEATTPAGDLNRVDATLWVAGVAYERGDAATAASLLDSAMIAYRAVVSADTPLLVATECAAGLAHHALEHREKAAALLPRCAIYERWGMADPRLIAQARRAMSTSTRH